jgi:hypothetical protein
MAPSLDRQLQHLQLSLRKFLPLLSGGQPVGDVGRQFLFAVVNGADGGGKFVLRRVLGEKGFGAGLNGAINVFIGVKGGEHDNAGGREILAQS